MESRREIFRRLREALGSHPVWGDVVKAAPSNIRVHLAIFKEPYLQFIIDGKKKIETRFSRKLFPPFEQASAGDIILLKRAGGAVRGLCRVEKVWFYRLERGSLEIIKEKFGPAICPVDESFWNERRGALFASLIWVGEFAPLDDFLVEKRDRRGWVIFRDG